jgi:hypothetical protein
MTGVRIGIAAAVMCVAAALAGCGGGGGGLPPSQASYFPLAEANVWSYQLVFHTSGGVKPAAEVGRRLYRTFPALAPAAEMRTGAALKAIDQASTVLGSEILGGKDYWAVEAKRLPDGQSVVQHMRMDETGLYAHREVDGQTSDICLLKLPPAVGDSWTVPGDDRVVFTTEAIDDPVTVPAGTFNCVRVRQVDSTYETSYTILAWFAYGVGLVQDNTLEGTVLTSELQLVSYELH